MVYLLSCFSRDFAINCLKFHIFLDRHRDYGPAHKSWPCGNSWWGWNRPLGMCIGFYLSFNLNLLQTVLEHRNTLGWGNLKSSYSVMLYYLGHGSASFSCFLIIVSLSICDYLSSDPYLYSLCWLIFLV